MKRREFLKAAAMSGLACTSGISFGAKPAKKERAQGICLRRDDNTRDY